MAFQRNTKNSTVYTLWMILLVILNKFGQVLRCTSVATHHFIIYWNLNFFAFQTNLSRFLLPNSRLLWILVLQLLPRLLLRVGLNIRIPSFWNRILMVVDSHSRNEVYAKIDKTKIISRAYNFLMIMFKQSPFLGGPFILNLNSLVPNLHKQVTHTWTTYSFQM